MRCARTVLLLAPALVVACAGNPDRQTLAKLRQVEPDMTEVRVEDGLDQAMVAYESFLRTAPKSALTPEAMRRLADLKLEKNFGALSAAAPAAPPAHQASSVSVADAASAGGALVAAIAIESEYHQDFERRAAAPEAIP